MDWPASVEEYEKRREQDRRYFGGDGTAISPAYSDAAIRDLKAMVEDYDESNETWLEVASAVGSELGMTPTYAIAGAPERIKALQAEVERLKWMLRLAASDYSVLDLVDSEDAYLAYLERRWAEREEE